MRSLDGPTKNRERKKVPFLVLDPETLEVIADGKNISDTDSEQ